MHKSPDEYNPDDWDGTDYAEECDPESPLFNRQGQGFPEDIERQSRNALAPSEESKSYTPDWSLITTERKIVANYCCSKCHLRIPERWTSLLHTHHMNEDKSDNHPVNLMVVCVDCHNKIHGFIISYVSPEDRVYLDKLREQQGISN